MELMSSDRGCVSESPEGLCGGERKATFFCASAAAVASLRAPNLAAGSAGSAGPRTAGEGGRPTPLSWSVSWGSSMGGRVRAMSGRGFVEAVDEGVLAFVPMVPVLADRWIWVREWLGM